MDFALSPTNMNTRTDRLDRRRGGKHGRPGVVKKWNKENQHKKMLKSLWKNRREKKFDTYNMTDLDFNSKLPVQASEETTTVVQVTPEISTHAHWEQHLADLKRITAVLAGTIYNGLDFSPSYYEIVLGKQVLLSPNSFARSLALEFEDEALIEPKFIAHPHGVKRKFAEVY